MLGNWGKLWRMKIACELVYASRPFMCPFAKLYTGQEGAGQSLIGFYL